MKLFLLTLLSILSMGTLAYADTCPPIEGLDPEHPPAGWESRPSPYSPTETHYFGLASHSFIGNADFKKVYCRYESCPGLFCSAFILVSVKQYNLPPFIQHSPAPWNARTASKYLISCQPGDNRPEHCEFE